MHPCSEMRLLRTQSNGWLAHTLKKTTKLIHPCTCMVKFHFLREITGNLSLQYHRIFI